MRRAGFVDRRHEPTLFAVRDLRKDLDLALDTFHRSEAPAPVTALVRELVGEAAADAADLDITAVITRYRPARTLLETGGGLPVVGR
jgi:3-hydroxyisobutyrate dehydrogenase-like beta-hydroxyacid dehydrogenase